MKKWRVAQVFGQKIQIFRGTLENSFYGYFSPEKKIIAISDEISDLEAEETLIHELLHATFDRLYIDRTIPPQLVEIIIENSCRTICENFTLKWKNRKGL